MTLHPLVMSVSQAGCAAPSLPRSHRATGRCLFCGGLVGAHEPDDRCCALCTLVTHLDRPRIDDEARLIWLPEMSQAALIGLVRETHIRLHAAGEALDGGLALTINSPQRAALHLTIIALDSRAALAASVIGIHLPSELGQALARLPRASYERRHRLLGSLRVLPSGHFFDGPDDIYPAIVESWNAEAALGRAA